MHLLKILVRLKRYISQKSVVQLLKLKKIFYNDQKENI